ncbi:MAG: hypothetical protein Q7U04_17495, partial [Bacteriovorax sp.]|nr:hypothetical protein [Bacteriovorax sp.]
MEKITILLLDFCHFLWWAVSKKKKDSYDLVIIRTDAIGDFVLWSSALEEILRHNINKKILLIGNDQWTSLAAILFPQVSVMGVNYKKLNSISNRYEELVKIVSIDAQELYYPVYSRAYTTGDSLALLIQAKTKIAFDGDL